MAKKSAAVRAIVQSDYRIAVGLFFIDTSFQVSNGVCSRYSKLPVGDSAFGKRW